MAIDNKKVLVISERDAGFKDTVARFLEELGLTPVILTEQPDQGMTIIEKFETYSDVGFALILKSDDDPVMTREDRFGRERQNIIFELGYLIGKLGHNRVLVVNKTSVGPYNDISGVNYISFDDKNRWKISVALELHAVGLDINASQLLPGDSTTDAPPPKPKKKRKN